jgi:hypothetical protein
MPELNRKEEPEPTTVPRRSRLVPTLGGVAGAAQMPLVLILSDYFISHRQPSIEHFLVGIPLGVFIGVLAGTRLTGRIEANVVGPCFRNSLVFGLPASLFCSGGFMMGGGSPEAGAVIFATYVGMTWAALAVMARGTKTTSG